MPGDSPLLTLNGKTYPQAARNAYVDAYVARLEVSHAVTASRLALEQLRQAEADFY